MASRGLEKLAARVGYAWRRAAKHDKCLDARLSAPLVAVLRELGQRLRPESSGPPAAQLERARPEVRSIAGLLTCLAQRPPSQPPKPPLTSDTDVASTCPPLDSRRVACLGGACGADLRHSAAVRGVGEHRSEDSTGDCPPLDSRRVACLGGARGTDLRGFAALYETRAHRDKSCADNCPPLD